MLLELSQFQAVDSQGVAKVAGLPLCQRLRHVAGFRISSYRAHLGGIWAGVGKQNLIQAQRGSCHSSGDGRNHHDKALQQQTGGPPLVTLSKARN